MGLLVITTLLWAASFSLIGEYLAGQVDSWFAVLVCVTLAVMVFFTLSTLVWFDVKNYFTLYTSWFFLVRNHVSICFSSL